MAENIMYMRLLLELKAAFPNLSDEIVKQCMSQVSKNGVLLNHYNTTLNTEVNNLFTTSG